METFAYYFQFYNNGAVLNEGYHYVVAKNITVAKELIGETFPKCQVLSYGKLSDNPIDLSDFKEKLKEHNLINGNNMRIVLDG